MKQYQVDFCLKRKQRSLLFYVICVQYTKLLPKKLPPPRPQAHRFRTLLANNRRRRAQMPGNEAQGTTERKQRLARFLLLTFLCAQLYIEKETSGNEAGKDVYQKCDTNAKLLFRLLNLILFWRSRRHRSCFTVAFTIRVFMSGFLKSLWLRIYFNTYFVLSMAI